MLSARFDGNTSRLKNMAGYTDGYFGHWDSTPPVLPNFNKLTGKKLTRIQQWPRLVMSILYK